MPHIRSGYSRHSQNELQNLEFAMELSKKSGKIIFWNFEAMRVERPLRHRPDFAQHGHIGRTFSISKLTCMECSNTHMAQVLQ